MSAGGDVHFIGIGQATAHRDGRDQGRGDQAIARLARGLFVVLVILAVFVVIILHRLQRLRGRLKACWELWREA